MDAVKGFALSAPKGPKPLRRPPHARYDAEGVPSLLPPDVIGTAVATGAPCPAGKAPRPDTCFLTHRYATRMHKKLSFFPSLTALL